MSDTPRPLRRLFDAYQAGALGRRDFMQGALALGVGLSTATMLAQSVAGQTASPAATPQATPENPLFVTDGKPAELGTEGQTHGAGGELRIIQYQAPTMLSPHVATGYKDYDAAQLVLEPLITYLPDSSLYGNLIEEVPSLENGLLAEDGLSVTFVLKEGLLWSDGEPVTAEDIKFTVDWVQNPDNASTNRTNYESIEGVDVQDDRTAVVRFSHVNPFWFEPFTAYVVGPLYPKHILEKDGAHDAFVTNPIGTGPYVVESFSPNDQIVFTANPNYREPNKPFFERVILKGGGDAPAAARAVAQTADFEFAWGPQVEPDILNSIVTADSSGVLVPTVPLNFERLAINFSDPNQEVDGQKSEKNTPNPALTDPAVRAAIAQAIDRQTITDNFYGLGAIPGKNVVNGDPQVDSPNTSWTFDSDAAAQTLEDAGWVLNGSVREKDGTKLSLRFASPINSRRQKTQSLIKANLDKIGFDIQLEQVDSGIFFDASPGNGQSFNKFYWDFMLYISPQGSPRPLKYMRQWYAGPDGENIAQESNGWSGSNNSRWQNADYDARFEATSVQTDPAALVDDFIALNDLVIGENVLVPLVVTATSSVASKRLRLENLVSSGFSGAYANIANWNWAE